MGEMETRVRKRARRNQLKSTILQIAAIAGLLTLAIAAPNMPKAIPRSMVRFIQDRSRGVRDVAVSRLVREGLLVRDLHNGIRILRITERGRRYLARVRDRYHIEKPRQWDQKWRIVIFDIREQYRKTRRLLRQQLKTAGFYRLQDSVWVYPYAFEEFIALLKSDLRVGKDILYLVAEELENDRHLRSHFNLPSR